MTPRDKWRPSLRLVVFGAVLAVAVAPLVILYAIKFTEDAFGVDFELHTIWDAGLVLAATVGLAVALAWLATRLLLRPVLRLTERTGEIERGAPDAFRPMGHYGTREMALLGDRFGRLARRLSRRNEELVVFSRHLSHEFKSPLTGIAGAVELLRDEPDMDAAQRDRFLANIGADAARLTALASGLRELATAELRDAEGSTDLGAAVSRAAAFAGLEAVVEGTATLPLSPDDAAIVLEQLARNAGEHGATRLHARVHEDRILICDDGEPIAPGDRSRLLDPFFTTKRERGGTGLGLSIASAVLARHGMTLAVASEPDFKFEVSPVAGRGRSR